ncbi:aminoglycoside phosphotransferase (APT) family kinase protein [Antricoccus suffuscus]|uniref:Aminoglycoside phosphotransferase (APT) family kinase protein n=1 Tax=Antricoccus suffuscus TaxID=1629062 RepID=A0A2T1A6G6_9ACTN|nr:phosphotransferase family protein [Antricoccus suffuscus]PRZ44203.1 aminoglycoside phosphotransferase (APT) family kinase protein [Antricoccus suffuscus]
MTDVKPLAARLATLLADEFADPGLEIRALRQLTGGASRETWAFEAAYGGTVKPLILRRDPPSAPRPDLMLIEAAALREAARVGVPEPEVVTTSGDPQILGAPFVLMHYVDGETLARKILREDAFAAVRPQLAAQCGEILAQIHTMDIDALPGLYEEYDVLTTMRSRLDELGWPSPTLELALRWLEDHRPAPTGRTVVHGDFRHGNLIIDPDGVRAVLDWEVVHIGDPMEDLGWMCVRAWRFGAPLPVGGFGEYDDLYRAYERVSGTPVDPDSAFWWQVLGTVRWGIGCMAQAERHLSGITRSVELAAIGRRVCEQEYDVLLLLRDRLAGASA